MGDQKLLPAPIPWYRTRLFWGVSISILLAWGIGYYFVEVSNPAFSTYDSFTAFSVVLGSISLGLLFDNVLGELTTTIFYYGIMLGLLLMTFRTKRVFVIYPMLFTIIFLIGHIIGVLYVAFI